MKYLSLLFLSILFSCSSSSIEIPAELVKNEQVEMSIDGMMCSKGCVGTINKNLQGLNGVVEFEVVFEEKKATVKYDNRVINNDEVIKTIEGIHNGMYKVTDFKKICLSDCEEEAVKVNERTDGASNKKSVKNPVDAQANLFSFELPNVFSLLHHLIR